MSSSAAASSGSASSATSHRFDVSPVPPKKSGHDFVKTAGCLIIGDEVLNGKTKDSNSNFLAKFLFDLAIDLKKIEVIADDEQEIVEAVRRMSSAYDLVITSGGIGPTHDDITYESVSSLNQRPAGSWMLRLSAGFLPPPPHHHQIAKAFDTTLQYDEETKTRMVALSKRRYNIDEQTEEQKTARNRMALFPVPTPKTSVEVLFVDKELWVPVVRVAGRVCILPGVPMLFERLLTGLGSRYINLPPSSEKPYRLLIHTSMPESSIAPFLTSLHERVRKEGVRVGSYPKFDKGVDVSLISKDLERIKELAQEVVKELKGEIVEQGKLGESK
ncbi:BZ3500_MvSof-1268-A1-R1_Chr5-3g08189 [Microbotryum saponariae]|uniref:BZ3500_MvSof-1268-A1-R1_Chr5-3g08189 protein n=1 Tax=Microbotryum saponariae TaxID=289078 RepID=A0A2X0KZP3_9BASI|nr:BZ3500_MvSof-1268-A1-R1_Chr5-3g08189 [Microbotryum saponariae]